jgi:NAD+ synthase
MAVLYAVAALYPNSRVVNTSNFSERFVGYSTKFGDGAGDFSPLGELLISEVLAIGDDLGLPHELVHKTPSDGMSGKSDEENLGFTYADVDQYLIEGMTETPWTVPDDVIDKIEARHAANVHKMHPMPTFLPETSAVDAVRNQKGTTK